MSTKIVSLKNDYSQIISLPAITEIIITACVFLLVIILPFYDTGELFRSYLTESTFLFAAAVSFIVILRVISFLFVAGKTIQIRISIPGILLFLFVCYIFLNRLFISELEGITIKQLRLVSLIIFYILLRTLHVKYHKFLIYSILISGIIQAIYGNLQLWGVYPSNHHLFNITGSFFNPGPYAGYLSMIFPIALGLYLRNAKQNKLYPESSHPNHPKQPQTIPNHPETT